MHCRVPTRRSKPADIHAFAYGLVRVLDDDNQAKGSWNPGLDADRLRLMMRKMLTLRAFDDRMFGRSGRVRPVSI